MTVPRSALIVGLGKSGLASARLLRALGVETRVYDRNPSIEGIPEGVEVYLGDAEPAAAAFSGIDRMILSPGVPPERFRALCQTYAPQAKIEGELGLALSLLPTPSPRLSLITGTNGKSTVTALLGELVRADGRDAFVGGNLGNPVTECVRACLMGERPWPTDLVLECSSYQLETLPHVPTAVAILLNITPDHLDRYPTMESYARTKARIFSGLGTHDLALLDAHDDWTDSLCPTHCQVARIGNTVDATLDSEEALCLPGEPPIPRAELRLVGSHNAFNALFALRAARHLGVSREACLGVLRSFQGLPHRMQWIRELDGVTYYNDSKATNAVSAMAGLGGLPAPFVWIAGGQEKGDDLTALGALVRSRARAVIGIGRSAELFANLAQGKIPAHTTVDLVAAIHLARTLAKPGDIVVLSPACASFDQFRSYAHRGDVFSTTVRAL